ncbi:MAG: glycosyltransferase [Candidatus Bathyarchaeota archaeon]|nr:glycosyltransferase [Candidatus Bathyarchaeota archaeon]
MSKLETGNAKNNSDLRIVFVVPTLNEEAGVGLVLDGISKVMQQNNYTVLVVDGHSEDKTVQIAKERGASIVFQRERGYGDALMTGFECACNSLKADILVMMDADGTYDPKDVPNLLNPILENRADLVVGNRFLGIKRGSMTFVNRVGNRMLSWIARRTLNIGITDTQCGLRALRADLMKHINFKAEGMSLATEMLAEAKQAKARIVEVPIAYHPRIGDTKLNPIKDGSRILGTILRLIRDYKPLLFFGAFGFIMASIGSFIGMNIVFEWLETGSVKHVPSLILSSMLVTTGFFVCMVGLLADMIKDLRKELRARDNRQKDL